MLNCKTWDKRHPHTRRAQKLPILVWLQKTIFGGTKLPIVEDPSNDHYLRYDSVLISRHRTDESAAKAGVGKKYRVKIIETIRRQLILGGKIRDKSTRSRCTTPRAGLLHCAST